jgi:hypothetical protein
VPGCRSPQQVGPYTSAMDVIWSATEPGTRRYVPTPVRSEPAGLDDHFRRLRRRRVRGYIEVEVPDVESPRLTIGFRGEYAVIHLLVAAPVARSFVLAGDDSVPEEAYVELPVRDELARFNGDVVLAVHRAWDLVQSFVRTGRAGELGEWHALQPSDSGGVWSPS